MRRFRLLLVVVCLVAPLFAASNAVPLVNQPLVPSSVPPGSASFTIRVNGAGFVRGAVVNWNGVPLATTFASHDHLNAVVPAVNVALPGTAMVTVTNPAPGGGTSNGALFAATLPTASLTFSTSVINVGVDPESVIAGDFNNDGKTDLVVFNLNQPDSQCYTFGGVGTIQTLLGNGAGGFTTAATACLPDQHETAGLPNLVAGDINGDGKLDLVAGYSFEGAQGNIATFLGDGTGTFTPQQDISAPDFVGRPVLADFNHDGKVDLAFPSVATDFPGIEVFLGDGAANFSLGSDFGPLEGNVPAVGDFSGDGILDLAVVDTGTPPLTILLGVSGGSFVEAATQPATTLVSPAWITTGDFNGDGILDLAFADSGSTALTILLGNGDGTFTQKEGQPNLGQTTTFIATADLNGDGKLDLVLVGSSDQVLIYLGNGDGTFRFSSQTTVGNAPTQLTVGDFNGDGRLDLAVTNSVDNTVSVLIQSPAVTLSHSSITFAARKVGTASPPRLVTLTNTGSARLAVQSVIASGDFSQTNNCGSSMPIGRSCQIQVIFAPTETGSRKGSITITDGANGSPQVITLSGTGT